MTSTRRVFLQSALLLAQAPLLSGIVRADTGPPLLVVVGLSCPTRDIPLGTLRRIFLGEVVTDSAGQRYVAFNQPPLTRPRTTFDQIVLGMNPDEVARYWVDQRIRFGIRPPRAVSNIPLLREVVARLPGAIGYLAQADLDPTVRVLRIDGLEPDAPRYPLR